MLSFLEFLGVSVIGAAIVSMIASLFKQPPILGFLILGIFAASFIGQLTPISLIDDAALIGISLLLFLIGTELNVSKIRQVGREAIVLGFGQVLFTTLVGYFLTIVLGFNWPAALIIAVALAFSSTVITVKLLSDKNDLDSLYGRLSLGMLLIQDMIAVVLLIFLGEKNVIQFANATIFFAGLTILSFILIPGIFNFFRRSSETLFFLSLGWLFIFIFSAKFLGLGAEIPAILAGISLAATPQAIEISRRLRPLKDLFLLFFFISLGTKIIFSTQLLLLAFVLSLFVLIANPLIVYWLLNLMGYQNRVSFLTGLTVAQISEFSLILGSLSKRAGYISEAELSILSLVGLFTFFTSAYFIVYNRQIYEACKNLLGKISFKKNTNFTTVPALLHEHIILIGFHRMGYAIAANLDPANLLVIEFNPELLPVLQKKRFQFIIGDAVDWEILQKANFGKAKMIISTIPYEEENTFLISAAKPLNLPIVVTALNAVAALELYELGADYVIIPHFLGGQHSAYYIKRLLQEERTEDFRQAHISEIKERLKLGHF